MPRDLTPEELKQYRLDPNGPAASGPRDLSDDEVRSLGLDPNGPGGQPSPPPGMMQLAPRAHKMPDLGDDPSKIGKIGGGEALARGAAQGISAGAVDELAGLVGGVGEVFNPKMGAADDKRGAWERFKQGFGAEQTRQSVANQSAAEQHPGMYGGGNFLGSAALIATTMGAGAPASTLSTGARIAQGAKAGASLGLAQGVLGTDGDLGDRLAGGAMGAATGGALGGAFGLRPWVGGTAAAGLSAKTLADEDVPAADKVTAALNLGTLGLAGAAKGPKWLADKFVAPRIEETASQVRKGVVVPYLEERAAKEAGLKQKAFDEQTAKVDAYDAAQKAAAKGYSSDLAEAERAAADLAKKQGKVAGLKQTEAELAQKEAFAKAQAAAEADKAAGVTKTKQFRDWLKGQNEFRLMKEKLSARQMGEYARAQADLDKAAAEIEHVKRSAKSASAAQFKEIGTRIPQWQYLRRLVGLDDTIPEAWRPLAELVQKSYEDTSTGIMDAPILREEGWLKQNLPPAEEAAAAAQAAVEAAKAKGPVTDSAVEAALRAKREGRMLVPKEEQIAKLRELGVDVPPDFDPLDTKRTFGIPGARPAPAPLPTAIQARLAKTRGTLADIGKPPTRPIPEALKRELAAKYGIKYDPDPAAPLALEAPRPDEPAPLPSGADKAIARAQREMDEIVNGKRYMSADEVPPEVRAAVARAQAVGKKQAISEMAVPAAVAAIGGAIGGPLMALPGAAYALWREIPMMFRRNEAGEYIHPKAANYLWQKVHTLASATSRIPGLGNPAGVRSWTDAQLMWNLQHNPALAAALDEEIRKDTDKGEKR